MPSRRNDAFVLSFRMTHESAAETRPRIQASPWTKKEVAMAEPMISLMAGVILVLCVAVVLVMHHRHPHIHTPKARGLDSHPPRDWRHRH
jgi:hypothetical protein